MKPVSKIFFIFFLLTSINAKSPQKDEHPVDIVFCTDLSGSTNGLIDDLRDRMWDIINQAQSMRPEPELRISVVGYARPSFKKENAYVKVISDLTTDFDQLSFELDQYKAFIEKGDQYVSNALSVAVKNVSWSKNPNAVKMIFLVGNGSVHTGTIDLQGTVDEALAKKIIIVPVYCTKTRIISEYGGWVRIGKMSGSELQEISVHKRSMIPGTTNDEQYLKLLCDKLNKTYIPFGLEGWKRCRMMLETDRNAFLADQQCFESRIFYRITDKYQRGQNAWDLVDFIKTNGKAFEKIDKMTLADSLQYKDDSYLFQLALDKKEEREKLMVEINKLCPPNRQEIINRQIKEYGLDRDVSLERVVVNALNKIARTNGYLVLE